MIPTAVSLRPSPTHAPRPPAAARPGTRRTTALALIPLLLVGCSADAQDEVLDLSAAASLQAPMTTIARDFEQSHPGVDVRLTFGGSADLAAQIDAGSPADVFASADEATMAKVATAPGAGPTPFATNTLTIVTEAGNPTGVRDFRDLTRPGLDVVVCAPAVPCGAATRDYAQQVGVTLRPRSEETKVTDVLAKVRAGEADAGLVYVTDAKGAGDAVTAVDPGDGGHVVNTYPVAVLAGTDQPRLAGELRAHLTSPAARSVLREAGFGAA